MSFNDPLFTGCYILCITSCFCLVNCHLYLGVILCNLWYKQKRPWNTPYGKKCTAANNFREPLANTLWLFGKHNLIWLTNIHRMFARCSLFTCKLGLPRILWVNSLRIFSEYVADMIQDSKLNMQRICGEHLLRISCEQAAINNLQKSKLVKLK